VALKNFALCRENNGKKWKRKKKMKRKGLKEIEKKMRISE